VFKAIPPAGRVSCEARSVHWGQSESQITIRRAKDQRESEAEATTMMPPSLYDKELQMFREKVHEANLAKLRFYRWLAEQGKLEHKISGVPGGEYAALQVNSQNRG
jgi:hypothetical protein